jgi:chromosome segregation ATPase
MCKKLAIVALLVAAGVVALKKFDIDVKCTRKGQATLEQRIGALEARVGNLNREIQQHIQTVAVADTKVERLREEVTGMGDRLAAQKRKILKMRGDLAGGSEIITYGDHRYSAERVREQLEQDFTAYKTGQKELEFKKKQLALDEEALKTSNKQLFALKNKKLELQVKVADLKYKLREVRLAQTNSKPRLDTGEFAQIEAEVARIEDDLKVEKKKLEMQSRFLSGPIDPEAKPATKANVEKEIDVFFKLNDVAEKK